TLQGIAKALNRKLEVNLKALEAVKQKCLEYAKKRGLPMETELTPPRVKMATLPQKTEPVPNPVGTAPGVRVDLERTILFALPGVPAEMEAIFCETIAPLIKQAVGNMAFYERSIYVDSIFESRLAPLIDRVMCDNEGVYVKSHPVRSESKPCLELHLTIVASQTQMPAEKLFKAAKELAVLIEENGGVVTAGFEG
ncbi:MAG TPA: molybdopterin-binding protein, partial [Candidatus Binatia bacterium]|nr:molybdopterin-binding protein [Candidatus Binatia bacterium]